MERMMDGGGHGSTDPLIPGSEMGMDEERPAPPRRKTSGAKRRKKTTKARPKAKGKARSRPRAKARKPAKRGKAKKRR